MAFCELLWKQLSYKTNPLLHQDKMHTSVKSFAVTLQFVVLEQAWMFL